MKIEFFSFTFAIQMNSNCKLGVFLAITEFALEIIDLWNISEIFQN